MQPLQEALFDISRQFERSCVKPVVKPDGFAERIEHHPAITAARQVPFQFAAQLGIELAVEVFIELLKQLLAVRQVIMRMQVHHTCSRSATR